MKPKRIKKTKGARSLWALGREHKKDMAFIKQLQEALEPFTLKETT